MRSSIHLTGLPVSTEAATRDDIAGIDRHLAAEAAADVGRDDADLLLRQADCPATSAKTVRMACGAWVVM